MSDDHEPGLDEDAPNAEGRSLTDTEIQDLLPGYVFDALDPDEMLAVEAFVHDRPEWQARLRSLEMAATSLAHEAPRARLPARTKQQLLLRARAELPPELAVSGEDSALALQRKARYLAPSPRGLRGLRAIPPAQPRPVQTGPGWFGIFWRSVAAAGAVAAVLLLAVLVWQLRNQVVQLAAQITTLQAQLTQVQAESAQLQTLNTTLQQQIQQMSQERVVLLEPQQHIALAGTADAPTASGDFYRRGEEAVLILRGLPPLPPEQTYQLWILPPGGGASLPADLFQVQDQTAQSVALIIPPEHANLIGVGVSIEPATGSQTPTTIVLLGAQNAPGA
jgi:anti-sigma-K factor RskA